MTSSCSSRIKHPLLFICDIQEGFRKAIHAYPHVIAASQKLLRAAAILKIPVVATTQKRERLGEICAELELTKVDLLVASVDKSRFSMWLPEIQNAVTKHGGASADVIIVGIETHICVLQTTLDALAAGNRVWICVDGVSSCNEGERRVALERMQREGAKLTTSESVIYEVMEDASTKEFKAVSQLVKDSKMATAEGVAALWAVKAHPDHNLNYILQCHNTLFQFWREYSAKAIEPISDPDVIENQKKANEKDRRKMLGHIQKLFQ